MTLLVAVGPPRTGTTWLDAALRTNPQITGARRKEVNYFDLFYDRGREWYLRQFAPHESTSTIVEVSPSYFSNQAVPRRIAADFPDSMVLVSLRDPVDRALSNWAMRRRRNNVSLGFADFVREWPEALQDSRYSAHLPRWIDLFGPDRLKVIITEDLDVDPGPTMADVASWLGVPNRWRLPAEHLNRGAPASHPRMAAAGHHVGSWLRRSRLDGVLSSSVAEQLRHVVLKPRVDLGAPLASPGEVSAVRAELTAEYEFASDVTGRPRLWR